MVGSQKILLQAGHITHAQIVLDNIAAFHMQFRKPPTRTRKELDKDV